MRKIQHYNPTEILRKSINQSGIPLAVFARRAKIGYPRFRRIVRYGQDPSLNEAVAIAQVLSSVAGLGEVLNLKKLSMKELERIANVK